jgi:hypothetical protein
MKRLSTILAIVLLLAIMLLALGCATKISDIKANPAQYEGKEITVSGTVSEVFWLGILSTGAYQIDDGSGTIWVVTKVSPPEKGKKASAKGTVSTGVKIGDQTLGLVINETGR